MRVLVSPGACVGAVGDPVSAGEALGASRASAAVARVVSVPAADVANACAALWAEAASPEASNAVPGCVAADPSPRFVLAAAALARSERLLAFWAASASAVSARVTSAATAPVVNAVVATWVVDVSAVAVGAVGDPVSAGDASGASTASAASARVFSTPVARSA